MFGFSFQKILFTVLAIAAVWYAFKWLGRLQDQRQNQAKVNKAGSDARSSASASHPGPTPDDEVEEMVKCAVCGDYVSKTAAVNCGRTGCPYPG